MKINNVQRNIFFIIVCILIFLKLSFSILYACFNLPHEWTKVIHVEPQYAESYFGILNLLYLWKTDFLDKNKNFSATSTLHLIIYSIDREILNKFINGDIAKVTEALKSVWLGSFAVSVAKQPIVSQEDIKKLLNKIEFEPELVLFIELTENTEEFIVLKDLISPYWVYLRSIIKANVSAKLKAFSPKDGLLYLSEEQISPTILVDTASGQSGSYQLYFEKRDARPMLVDFGEIFAAVNPNYYNNRPDSYKLPNVETSIPMEKSASGENK